MDRRTLSPRCPDRRRPDPPGSGPRARCAGAAGRRLPYLAPWEWQWLLKDAGDLPAPLAARLLRVDSGVVEAIRAQETAERTAAFAAGDRDRVADLLRRGGRRHPDSPR